MAQQTKAGILLDGVTTASGVSSFGLPLMPCVVVFFITIEGSASLNIILRDGKGAFIPVKTLTASAVVRLSVPASEVGVDLTSNSGTVTVTYRSVVVENVPNAAIEVFTGGEIQPATIITLQDSTGIPLEKKLAQTTLLTTAAVLYTVPASTQAKIIYIVVANPTGTGRTFTLYHDGTDDAHTVVPASTVVAGGFAEFNGPGILMEPGDTLAGKASAAAALTIQVYGIETTTT
jgi:hypothetical protein